jgi:hypothetical protein
MDDGHAQLMSWLEVGGDVIHEHDPPQGNGQLVGGSTVDSRLWLAQSHLAGDHHRVELLIELVASIGIIGGGAPGVGDHPDPDPGRARPGHRFDDQGLRPQVSEQPSEQAGRRDPEELRDLLLEGRLAQRSAFHLVVQLTTLRISGDEVAEAVVGQTQAFTMGAKAAKKSVVTTPPKSRSRPS